MSEDDLSIGDEVEGDEQPRDAAVEQAKAKAKAKSEEAIARDGCRNALQSRDGRRWMFSVLSGMGVWKLERTPFELDAAATAHRCGTLDAGQRLAASIRKLAPSEFKAMLIENMEGLDGRVSSGK